MSEKLAVLRPAYLGGLQLRNRLVVPPMVTHLGDERGNVTDALIAYAAARAAGGFGLYILEATYVDPVGKGFTRGVGIDADDKIPGLRRLTDAVHACGGKISIQLHHAGRETSSVITGTTIVAPSNCPVCYSEESVHELSVPEIQAIVSRFAQGARRAKEAGFDAVMIHGAHGYLLTQFLSPYTNKRTDDYGGGLENRLRISREIIDAIRREVGTAFPVTYRMTVEEGIPGGLTVQESALAAKALCAMPIDCLHIVAGNYATNHLIIPPACYGNITNKGRLQAIREAVGPGFPLAVAGRITNVLEAEELYQQGLADFVAMGRASLADPELPKRSPASVRTCIGCNEGCIGRTSKDLSIRCALNPCTGREVETPGTSKHAKKVLVIGGGPAGMEAAWLAARRGHRVTLAERASRLGGQFLLAAYPPHKNDIFTYISNMRNRLDEAGVKTLLGCTVDAQFLDAEKPDLVYLATGGTPLVIDFPGLESVHTVSAHAVLRDSLTGLGQNVAVIGGGMVGCETAELIATSGRHVDIVEMLPELAGDLFFTAKNMLLHRLATLGVVTHPDRKVVAIKEGRVICTDTQKKRHSIGPVDSIVLALGARPDAELETLLNQVGIAHMKIGDCAKAGNCRHATSSAFSVVNNQKGEE